MPKRHHVNPPLNLYKKIALTFIVLTIILIGIIFYFTLSYAYLTIYPKSQEIKNDFNFIIVEDQSLQDIEAGIFAGRVVNQIISDQKSFETTGTKDISADAAGSVKLVNTLNQEQILIPKTRLLTPDNILFRLKDRVIIPGKSTVTATVYPDDPSKPLATAGTKFTIPGLNTTLQKYIYAETAQDFQAGGQTVKAISQSEVDKAVAEFSEEAAQKVFASEDSSKTKILSKEITEQILSNKVGDAVDSYTLTLKIKVVGVIFDAQPVKTYAQKLIESLVPNDKVLVSNNADQLIYVIEKYDMDNKLVQIKSTINGVAVLRADSPILDTSKLVKLSSAEVQSYLENFEDIEKAEITFFPAWVKKMPRFPDHIIIKIK